MALFELASAQSGELVAANQLADRLSESVAFQQLAEKANSITARAKITVGIAADPLLEDELTPTELANQHVFAQVYSDYEDAYAAGLDSATQGNPREGGLFRVYLRRQVREAESRADAYLFFWDRVAAIPRQVVAAAEALNSLTNRNRFRQAQRLLGPEFGTRGGEGAQGLYLHALLKFTWGDVTIE